MRFSPGSAAALRRHPEAAARGGTTAEAVAAADRPGCPGRSASPCSAEHVLDQVPLLLVLDNFDDNLSLEAGTCTIRDPSLIEFLTSWAAPPHRGRLLITCRHRFAVPEAAASRLGFRHLGPLSRSGAIELAMSLPALGLLGEPDLDRTWRLLGRSPPGHGIPGRAARGRRRPLPGRGRPPRRGDRGADRSPGGPPGLAAPTELPLPTAEAAALAVADLLLGDLFGRLSAEAQGLLIRASVYRAPIGRDVLLLPVGQYSPAELGRLLDECRASGLLAADSADRSALGVRAPVDRLRAAPPSRRAAARRRGHGRPPARRRILALARHRLAARSPRAECGQLPPAPGQRAEPAGPGRRPAPGPAPAPPAAPLRAGWHRGGRGRLAGRRGERRPVRGDQASRFTPAACGHRPARRAATRQQAAAWVASQVSGDAIVACDPAMCAVLLARGVSAGNLLVLRSAASDPLGSDVVLATPAVRSQFGARLASVYAPQVIASFGSGALRIDVRAVAPDGAAAFQSALAADLAARRAAGSQLLRNSRISASPGARAALLAGQLDSRLLITLAAMAAAGPLRIESFGGSGPGAGPRPRCGPPSWRRPVPRRGRREPAEHARFRAGTAPAVPGRARGHRPGRARLARTERGVRRAQPGRPAADAGDPLNGLTSNRNDTFLPRYPAPGMIGRT